MLRIGRKSQFFIISSIIIITSLLSVNQYLSSYTAVDLTFPFSVNEDYIFWNIKSELNETVHSTPCPELEERLKKFELFVEEKAMEKGIELNITYQRICPKPVKLRMVLTSEKMKIRKNINISS